jgi:DNA-binding response OmpR family regulator
VLRLRESGRFRFGDSVICGLKWIIVMNLDTLCRLERLTSQLAETLMTAVICAEELRAQVRAEFDGDGMNRVPNLDVSKLRPIMSETTLTVSWNGSSLYLGHTLYFRLLERLARRPNQYVTHLDLLRDVWDNDETATSTIRSVVRYLRRRLREGGMGELAHAIRGHNGRYILEV